MRVITSWVPDSLDEMVKFARMNSLPKLRLSLDKALAAYKEDEMDVAKRN